jgi:hypothetical protein
MTQEFGIYETGDSQTNEPPKFIDTLEISKSEMELILKTLKELPQEWYIEYFWTEEQHNHWDDTKTHYLMLHEEMQAYFQGRASQLENLSDHERLCYATLKDVQLALYDLLRYGWRAIQKAVHDYKINFPYNEPGELFSALMENQAAAKVLPCLLGRHDIKFRQTYRLGLKIQKSKGDKKKTDQCRKEIDQLLGRLKHLADLQVGCIQCCRNAARQSKDELLYRKLADYDRLCDELSKLLKRNYRDKPAQAWQKGEKLQSQKAGGTYTQVS